MEAGEPGGRNAWEPGGRRAWPGGNTIWRQESLEVGQFGGRTSWRQNDLGGRTVCRQDIREAGEPGHLGGSSGTDSGMRI